ncbi:hypothetical protein ACIQNU_25555 [Streptomyces sp. NPDC091292]|uniref:hypothetical protein n=1 Tax=Streptomyces sp. NPDC091292 TaxID=3365991 RepID=UPI0038299DF0
MPEPSIRGIEMFEYEMHEMRAAELHSEAAHRRLVREARAARRAAARHPVRDASGGRVSTGSDTGWETTPGTGTSPTDHFTRAA